MHRRSFLASAAAAALPQFSFAQASKPPNILFLFTDDQRFSTIHALNNPQVRTPAMDRLARQGVAFTRAHIMGGTIGAVCAPSRGMLMTGQTLFHAHDNTVAGIAGPKPDPNAPKRERRPFVLMP